VSHAGRGETRFPAADGLGCRGLVHFVRSGKLPSGSFLSAFINADNLRRCDPAAQETAP